MNLALTSDTATTPQLYDVADSILAQKISQIPGVGQVTVGGSSRPGVRAEVNPLLLSKLGVGLDQVRTRARQPPMPTCPRARWPTASACFVLNDNDQLFLAKEYAPLIVAYHNGAPVRLSDVATVVDSQENIRNAGIRERQARRDPASSSASRRPTSSTYRGPRASAAAAAAGLDSAVDASRRHRGPHHDDPRLGAAMSRSPWSSPSFW